MTTATDASTPRPRPGTSDTVLVDPGWLAVHLWNIYADLKDAGYRTVDCAAVQQLVTRSGIGPDSTVVFYGYAPALGVWLMTLYGHRDVRILDCSRATWRAAGYPWSTAASEPPPGGMGPGGRAGHAPSAVHQPLDGIYTEDGSFRSAAELREVFAPHVLEGSGELITYCTIGGRAATAWFVLTCLLGRARVRVYDGSWAEWGRIPGTPVEGPGVTT